MAKPDDDTSKPHEPTAHKLEQARKKGDIARASDLTSAAAYGGILLVALAAGAASVEQVGSVLQTFLAQPDRLVPSFFGDSARPAVGSVMVSLAAGLIAWFAIPAALAVLTLIGTRSFVFATDKLRPKTSRLNLISNAKQKFGISGLFEFSKSTAKLICYSILLGVYLTVRLPEMAGAIHAEPRGIGLLMVMMMVDFMKVVVPLALSIGAIDFLWQRFDHARRNRMSHQEVKDEHKQTEGDPHMKQERRQRAHEIATSQMMSDVPTADVVIVNPTHFAVALKWSRSPGAAPECVAKGVDHVALAIREKAAEHGVPVRHDPPTARALYATTEIGQEISQDHYRAVAAAIRFADAMRRKMASFG